MEPSSTNLDSLIFYVERQFGRRIRFHGAHQRVSVLCAHGEARHPERDRIAEKNFGERFANHSVDAATLQRLWRVFA